MPGLIKCDLHIHSQFSDGKHTIGEIVDLYGSQGFGAIAITDHLCENQNVIGLVSHHLNYTLSRATFPHYMKTIEREAQRAWREYEMLVLPGFEITKNSFINHRSAHILILGSTEYIEPDLPVDEILTEAKSRGALTIAAHPFFTGNFEFQTLHLWSRRQEIQNLLDAWEMNHRQVICNEVLTSGLPLIANSDFHHQGHMKSWKTKIHCKKNQSSLFHSIRQQRLDFFLE